MSAFIEKHRERFGVEPICATLEVSASAYYERARGCRSPREIEDERLLARIAEIHERNYCAYGYRRMWIALKREGEEVGRGRVQRLMRTAGIQGAKRRGKAWRTTKPDPQAQREPDLVKRDFSAAEPNRLWVGDLSYLRCWEGVVFFAFVIDAFSRKVVGWQPLAWVSSLRPPSGRAFTTTPTRHTRSPGFDLPATVRSLETGVARTG